MRKITSESAYALMACRSYKSGNTKVIELDASNPGAVLELHGNAIAKIIQSGPEAGLYVRSAGWETATTKERLNGIVGVHVIQKAGQWYLNGEKWENSEEWTKIKN